MDFTGSEGMCTACRSEDVCCSVGSSMGTSEPARKSICSCERHCGPVHTSVCVCTPVGLSMCVCALRGLSMCVSAHMGRHGRMSRCRSERRWACLLMGQCGRGASL